MSKQIQDAYIVAATRTPIGRSGRGYFRRMRPDDLLIAAIRSAMTQVPTLDPAAIEDAIVGCSFPEGEQGMNMARVAVALAGFPKPIGGVTVNRFCASGLTAIQIAADRIRVGEADVMIAGGAESMSLVPMGGNKPSFNPRIFEGDENIGIAYGMGLTAEKVALQWKVSREAQDAFALESHQRALKAQAAGEFADETTPIEVVERFPDLAGAGEAGEQGRRIRTVTLDEGPRPDTSLEGLAKLKPVFAAPRDPTGKPTGMGSVTAGNSSQTSDGAGALDARQRGGGQAVRPEAAGALRQLREPRRAARDHGHRPDRGDSGGAALCRAEASTTWAGSSSTRRSRRNRSPSSAASDSIRRGSIRWAARSPSATRSARPARSARPRSSMRCAGAT